MMMINERNFYLVLHGEISQAIHKYTNELHHEKTCRPGFRPGPTQTEPYKILEISDLDNRGIVHVLPMKRR